MSVKYGKHNRGKPKFQRPGHYAAQDRDKIDPADFAGPDHSFPIVIESDVADAARLVGHAADPAAVKARIKAIAKRKGFALPQAWQDEEGRASSRGLVPEVLRAADAAVSTVGFATITRVNPDKREVTLTATSESRDSFKTRFDYEASKDAFLRWAGNVREMHQAKAVGNRVDMVFDDERRKIDVTLRISKGAQDTWEKVLDNTLKGGSIGASNVVWEKPVTRNGEEPIPVAKKYDLVELSLVDNPSNPDCVITAIRGAQPDESLLDIIPDPPEPAPIARLDERPKGRSDAAALPPAIAAAMAAAYGDPPPTATRAESTQETPSVSKTLNDQARERQQRQAAAQARQAKITEAGNAAVRAAGLTEPPPTASNYNDYVQRVAAVRGAAEADAARQLPAIMGRFAAPVAPPPVTRYTDAAMAPDTAASPMSVAAASLAASLDDQASPSHPLPHVHTHAHTHTDGTTHSHPHLHHHDSHVLRMAAGDDAPHTDAEVEHAHTYRSGQPIDTALLAHPDLLRGTPWQVDPIKDANKAAGNVSGTQLVAAKMSTTGVDTMQPQGVGHPIMYNSEDANMLGFAVPTKGPAAPPTPTENLTLDPAMFHAGGHKPRFDNVHTEEPMADQDGDHDREEDAHELAEGDKTIGTPLPMFTTPNRDVEPTPRSALADYVALSADYGDALSSELARLTEPEEARYGARNSAVDIASLHGIRDNAYQTAQMVTDHCGCDECQSHAPVIIALTNGEPPDMSGDDDEDEDDERASMADTQRLIASAWQQVAQVLASVTTRLKALEAGQQEQRSALADLHLSIADTQRLSLASTTRATDARLAALDGAMSGLVQRMEASAAAEAEIKAIVERIALTPVPQNAPIAPWTVGADKTLGGVPTSSTSIPAAMTQWLQEQGQAAQIDLATRLMAAK